MTSQFAPHFFLVGAPKCGTTALYTYLAEHQAVWMSQLKEPHFFSTDLPGLREVHADDAYAALFCGAGERLCGEASTSYLYSRNAIPTIRARSPTARVVVLLRNPVDAAYALHQDLKRNLIEDVTDFERAWRLQEARREGDHVPRKCREPAMLQYRAVYHYSEQLTRLFENLPAQQVLILLFDTFAANPKVAYERVLTFLDLEHDHRDSFSRVNAARALRSRSVSRAHRAAPAMLGPLYHPMKRTANAVGIYPSRALERWNVAPSPRPPLSSEFRRELLSAFEPDIQAIEDILGHALAEWR